MKNSNNIMCVLINSFLTSCSSDDKESGKLTHEHQIDLMIPQLRSVAADFQNMDMSINEGWDTNLSSCVKHTTESGMGRHYARLEFLDGRVNHL